MPRLERLDLQLAFVSARWRAPCFTEVRRWVDAALAVDALPGAAERASGGAAGGADPITGVELTVRIVDAPESRALNRSWRDRDRPTNVLAFPNVVGGSASGLPGWPDEAASAVSRYLGDVVICLPVCAEEATTQGKSLTDHCAHLVVHGVLHLLGYDHQDDEQAGTMERKERRALARIGVADPYETADLTVPSTRADDSGHASSELAKIRRNTSRISES